MKINKKVLAHLALLAVAIIYGVNYSVAKDVMPVYIKPLGFIMVRVIGATALFWLTALALKWERVETKDLLRLSFCGLFGVASNQMLFFQGLSLTTPVNASVMMTINPVLVVVLSAVILKEPLKSSRILGIALGIAGAVFLIVKGSGALSISDSNTSWGNILIFFNALSYGIYLVIVKPLMHKYEALTVIRWVFLFGLCICIPFGGSQFLEINWAEMPSIIAWEVVFVVLGTTYMAYLFNVYALKTVTSTTVSFYIYLQPLFAAITAIALGKDHITLTLMISALLLFTGVYLVSFYKR